MARWYYLTTAFSSGETATDFTNSLNDRFITLSDGVKLPCRASMFQAWNGVFWCDVIPEGISMGTSIPPKLSTQAQLDQVAATLYQWLKDWTGYQCALVGWEVGDKFIDDVYATTIHRTIRYDDFMQPGWSGVVIPEKWAEIPPFQPFAPGYVWLPYRSLGISGW